MIKVTIVEDSIRIREGLKLLIDGTEELRIIGSYSTCEAMLKDFAVNTPDVILMDIDLPGMSGIEGIRQVKKINQDCIILVLTIYDENDYVFDALCAGASGYLVKRTPPSRLLEAIKEVYDGGAPMSAHIARKVVDFFKKQKVDSKQDTSNLLTKREKQVLKKLVEGNSHQAISDSLYISIETVRYHFRNIYKKLHVHSQLEAVVKAINEKLI